MKILKKIDKYDIIIFMLVLVVYLLYLFIMYPGVLTYDSYIQLGQIISGEYNDWHPFAHTFFELLCWKIMSKPAFIGFVQIIIFDVIWTAILKYNRKKRFWPQLVATILLIINPINPVFAITLWKDVIYSYVILLMCFLMQIMFDKKFVVSKKFAFLVGFILVLILKLRYNGTLVFAFLLIYLLYKLFKTNKRNSLILLGSTLIFISSFFILNKVFRVEYNQKDALSQKITQYIGIFTVYDVVEEDDKKIIDSFIKYDCLKEKYNPYFADSIYECKFSEKGFNVYKKDIYKMVIKYTFKYPSLLKKFALESSTLVWQVPSPKDMIGHSIETGVAATNNFMDLKPKYRDELFYATHIDYLNNSLKDEFLNAILYNPALYFYMTIVLLIVLRLNSKAKGLLIILPSILNVISIVPSLPVQDARYLYNNFIVFYFTFVILYNYYYLKKSNKEYSDKSKIMKLIKKN